MRLLGLIHVIDLVAAVGQGLHCIIVVFMKGPLNRLRRQLENLNFQGRLDILLEMSLSGIAYSSSGWDSAVVRRRPIIKKTLFVVSICLLLSAGFVLVGCGPGQETQAGPQTTCPVMSRTIDKKYYIDYEGKRVYFCCNSCPKSFEGDPEKYMKKLADAGAILEDAPEDHSSHEH